MIVSIKTSKRRGHTLVELMAATVASGVLLAGLGSVMLIARQIAYAPSASTNRIEAAEVVNELADELRYATLIVDRSDHAIEFVVADRDSPSDGRAEQIRYEWSGVPGDPLLKTYNAGLATEVVPAVEAFELEYTLQSETIPSSTLAATADSAEVLLASNTNVAGSAYRDIASASHSAQQINPAAFTSPPPANTVSWNATRAEFHAQKIGQYTGTLLVDLRSAGAPNGGPTSQALGQAAIPEASLATNPGWNVAPFSSPARGLSLQRTYALVWAGVSTGIFVDCRMTVNDSAASGVLESSDGGASWQYMPARQVYYRLYGTYTYQYTPETPPEVTRSYFSAVSVSLQTADAAHSRVDASIPLVNRPELLSAYWQTNFDTDPTTIDVNGDDVDDWETVTGTLQTRPLNDFTGVTIVEARCQSSGGGEVLRIDADRQAGVHVPLSVTIAPASNSQTLNLLAGGQMLKNVPNLAPGYVRIQLLVVPEHDLVNLQINGQNVGTFNYTTSVPSTNERCLSANTTNADFDYVELRVLPTE